MSDPTTGPAEPATPAVAPELPEAIAPRAERDLFWWLRFAANAVVLIACGGIIFWVLQPSLIFLNTTTAGGDTGAHVWWPHFLRDSLLPLGRIAGWSKDYYAGFPAGQFYFPVPALMIVLLDMVMPYNIAFKLVTASGAVLLPASAFVFGRGLKIKFPGPALMGAGTLGLLFFAGDPRASQKVVNGLDVGTAAFNQRIMGGTLASTLAGEFSFTIALCFALCFLGVFAATLRGGKRPGWAALLLALTVCSHLVVGIFVIIATCVVLAFRFLFDERRKEGIVVGALLLLTVFVGVSTISVWLTAPFVLATAGALVWFALGDRNRVWLVAGAIAGVGGLLTGVWTLPLVARFPYTSNMRYEKLTDHLVDLYLFPNYGLTKLFPGVFFLGVIAIAVAIAVGRRSTFIIATITAAMGVLFVQWPEAHAWNLRFLPFWYLGWMLLAGIGTAEMVRAPAAILAMRANAQVRDLKAAAALPVPAGGEAIAYDPAHAAQLRREGRENGLILTVTLAVFIGVLVSGIAYSNKGFLSYWAEYNYTGYEWVASPAAKSASTTEGPCNIPARAANGKHVTSAKAYPEFQQIMETMGSLPPGRALWEPSASIDKYGTTLALELLPYCTNGRIASMEGLYFEAAGTTPYHFITVSELAQQPSNPMRFPKEWGAYGTLADFDLGVRHLQQLGVRYYMAQSEEAKRKAAVHPDLRLVADIPDIDGQAPSGWKVYEVANAPLVEPLAYAPVVVSDQPRSGWQQSEPQSRWLVDWFNDDKAVDRALTDGGPKDWKRIKAAEIKDTPFGERLAPVEVTNVRETQNSVSFDVSKVGVPVLVKTSYYPAWKVTGAKGPYRAAPNFMVVVPTSNHVELNFTRTPIDWIGILATLAGIAGLVVLFRWVPPLAPELAGAGGAAPEDDDLDDPRPDAGEPHEPEVPAADASGDAADDATRDAPAKPEGSEPDTSV